MPNSFGKLFTISTWGESHGGAVGVVIDGCPPNLPLTEEDIQLELDRRQIMVVAVSLGMGLGVSMVPDALGQTPDLIRNIFSSAPATSGLSAIFLSFALPRTDL